MYVNKLFEPFCYEEFLLSKFTSTIAILLFLLLTLFKNKKFVSRGTLVNESISAATPLGAEWRDPLKNPALRRGLLEEGLAIFTHRQGAFLSQPVLMTNVEAAGQ